MDDDVKQQQQAQSCDSIAEQETNGTQRDPTTNDTTNKKIHTHTHVE